MTKNFYITFGQSHYHNIGGVILNKDTVAVVEGRDEGEVHEKAMRIFGGKFSRVSEAQPDMFFFPKGLHLISLV